MFICKENIFKFFNKLGTYIINNAIIKTLYYTGRYLTHCIITTTFVEIYSFKFNGNEYKLYNPIYEIQMCFDNVIV